MNTPIIWLSKRQNIVESSSLRAEFVALRIATDLIEALRYKLRMFGIDIDGPADVFVDNKFVVTNASVPESTLSKKKNSICYHRCRDVQASGQQRVAWIEGTYNQADSLTQMTLQTGVFAGICHEIFGWRDKSMVSWE